MNNRLSLAVAAGAVIFTTAANADITGAMIELVEPAAWLANGYDPGALDTYRLYLLSDNPADQLNAVFGNGANPMVVTSGNGAFVNTLDFFGEGSLTAPADQTAAGHFDNQWDTYVTIDTDQAAGDSTALSPGFDGLVNNLDGSFTVTNGSWFVTVADAPQGNFDGGMALIAQFTVADGVSISGVVHAQIAGGAQFTGLDFATEVIPAPGAFALLGVAGLLGRRRRRA